MSHPRIPCAAHGWSNPWEGFVGLHDMVLRQASTAAEREFFISATGCLTYGRCAEAMLRAAAGLLAEGVEPGQRVACIFSSRKRILEALLACSAAGAVFIPLNGRMPAPTLCATLRYLRPHWIVADSAGRAVLARMGSAGPWKLIGPPWDQLERHAPLSGVWTATPDDLCYVDLTSGSLGAPKGVPRTHGSIWCITASAAKALGLTPQDRHLCLFAPFAHPHEALARAALLGAALVLLDTIRPHAVIEAIGRHGVTCVMAVPTVYGLLSRALPDSRLSTVRLWESGGAPTPEALVERFASTTNAPLTPVWGCTEVGGIAIAGVGPRPRESVGRLCPGFEALLHGQDEWTEETLPGGDTGELALRGPSVATEYVDLPHESAQAFREGWYFTGDIFTRDPEGFFYFRGRRDEMFKVRGFKVFPSEVERVLLMHPDVAEAAVVPGTSPDDRPVAFVVSRGPHLSEASVRALCRSHLPPHQVPRIVRRASLPKTPSGKILRRLLWPGCGSR